MSINSAFANWEYKVVKATRHPYVVCHNLSRGCQPVIYVATSNKIKNTTTAGVRFGTCGRLDVSVEDIKEWLEVIELAKDIFNET